MDKILTPTTGGQLSVTVMEFKFCHSILEKGSVENTPCVA
jgi:hypothetical protein